MDFLRRSTAVVTRLRYSFRRKLDRDSDDEDQKKFLPFSSSSSSSSSPTRSLAEKTKIGPVLLRWLHRLFTSSVFRYLLLVLFSLYVLMVWSPLRNASAFYPSSLNVKRRFLLVVAHPDDESLFFNPTLFGLIDRGHQPHLIVFSQGNFEGLGPVRREEMRECCKRLTMDSSHCFILEGNQFVDDPRSWWKKENVSRIVEHYLRQWQIDLLITFDQHGISGHLNHRSLFDGVQFFSQHQDPSSSSSSSKLLIYQLKSASILRKFVSIFNLLPTFVSFVPRLIRSVFVSVGSEDILFVNSPTNVYRGLHAFYAHRSQLRWFRHLYTFFSQYMFINQLNALN